jgi:16S rRNA (guanine966-N2)-methyltransferase
MAARSNQVRIIAGRWRSRRISFPDMPGLRPTSDRVRETLFNWLAPELSGATCLDLFAGSGALGFEAASRGAARVVMVERNDEAVRALRENQQRLAASMIEIAHQDAETYLAAQPEEFDVVFLDPPFDAPWLLEKSTQLLTKRGWLKDGARIYIEMPANPSPAAVPQSWEVDKRGKGGQVMYRLYRYRTDPGSV